MNVNPNLSLGIIWHGPTFSCLVNANADENNDEIIDNLKNMSKAMASPLRLLTMMKTMMKSCGTDSTSGSEK